jgi:hypothetical protein
MNRLDRSDDHIYMCKCWLQTVIVIYTADYYGSGVADKEREREWMEIAVLCCDTSTYLLCSPEMEEAGMGLWSLRGHVEGSRRGCST